MEPCNGRRPFGVFPGVVLPRPMHHQREGKPSVAISFEPGHADSEPGAQLKIFKPSAPPLRQISADNKTPFYMNRYTARLACDSNRTHGHCIYATPLVLFCLSLFLSVAWVRAVVPPSGLANIMNPAGGFNLEGDLYANTPTVGQGDWTYDPGLYPGAGRGVLYTNGEPINPNVTYHLIDSFTTADNIFGSGPGIKYDANPNLWNWTSAKALSKDDMNHVLIHFDTEMGTGHRWVFVAADRESDNGDAYIDFEFLQNTLTVTTNADGTSGNFVSTGPHGGRTVNDFLLTIHLVQGGSMAEFFFQRWAELVDNGATYYDYVDAPFNPSKVLVGVNTNYPIAVPWGAYGRTNYLPNTFAEGGVDLTELLGNLDPCLGLNVRTILVKTKTSHSDTANLVDFVAPIQLDIQIGPSADAGPDQSVCDHGDFTTFTMDGSVSQGLAPITGINWSVVASNGLVQITDPGATNTTVKVYGSSATLRLEIFSLIGAIICTNTDDVVLTVNPAPSCAITNIDQPFVPQNGTVCPGSGPYSFSGPTDVGSYKWIVTGDATIVGPTNLMVVQVQPSGPPVCNGSFTVRLELSTPQGCLSVCEYGPILVRDQTPPTISCVGPKTYECTASWAFDPPSFSDACGTPTLAILSTVTNATCGNTYVATRTWSARDACGNSNTCSQVITVVDTTAPTISQCPPNRAIERCEAGGLTLAISTTKQSITVQQWINEGGAAADSCGGILVSYQDVVNGTCPTIVTRTFTVSDNCTNAVMCVQVLTFDDTIAPSITCPPAQDFSGCNVSAITGLVYSTNAVSINLAQLQAAGGNASDACGIVSITYQDTQAGNCPVRVTRKFIVTDNCGNTNQCTQNITITDRVSPTITAVPGGADLGCKPTTLPTDASVRPQVTASDACGSPVTINVSHVDATGANCVKTRTFSISATDVCNNTSATQTVVYTWVDDNAGPVISLPQRRQYYCPGDRVIIGPPAASDDCGVASIRVTMNSVEIGSWTNGVWTPDWPVDKEWMLATGFYVVVVTATDHCGNVTTSTFRFWKLDDCTQYCSLTQGFYGSQKGKFWYNGQLMQGFDLVESLLNAGDAHPGQKGVLIGVKGVNGVADNYLLIKPGQGGCIAERLPAGGRSEPFPGMTGVGHGFGTECETDLPLDRKGKKFVNNALGQIISLSLNVRLDTNLFNFKLQQEFCTLGEDGSLGRVSIPNSVWTYLTAHYAQPTVGHLLKLANDVLGGAVTTVDATEAGGAAGAINGGFDECRIPVPCID